MLDILLPVFLIASLPLTGFVGFRLGCRKVLRQIQQGAALNYQTIPKGAKSPGYFQHTKLPGIYISFRPPWEDQA